MFSDTSFPSEISVPFDFGIHGSGEGKNHQVSPKRSGTEQLSIEWELGSGDDEYLAGEVTYTVSEVADLSKPSADMGKFLSDTVCFHLGTI